MISPRRIVAAAALAAGFTGLAAPMANAAEAPDAGKLNPIAALDALSASQLPPESRGQLPKVSRQVSEVKNVQQLSRLNELHQVTDLAAPVTGLLPAVQT
ncbi:MULTISPECIES: hypothetical protein [Streptomyces]|uniref:Secreted protein n=1 Tax=Streptomyces antibioticus TaxID=1890 RepID=A0AAE7CP35_STRAT|nr:MULTISPECIES: hypothetical protein [Streptomyces]MBO7941117.1 hypothetical protein [Streptomyces sp. S9]MCX4741600.1 hypothetical protein [Streptomyces antibioticus]MCX5172935.1 hypothetical protein [Streptomyces antibioticus]NUV58559.1 hypothetical protein [Streptomyces sp. CAI-85]OOQ47676.1 hypothetical protein AFM16_33810 [Streptomyces antibioticus]